MLVAGALALSGLGVTPTVASQPRTWVVDADGVQCGNADFSSIQAAVDAAQPGDVVRVCPDVYAESVLVDKPLTLKGDPESVVGLDCLEPTPAQLGGADPARYPIVDPWGDGVGVGFRLQADDIVLAGFLVQGASVGVDLSDRHSGYDLHHNMIRLNSLFAVDLGSDGAAPSRVHHNCIRENRFGLVSELDDDSLWKSTDGAERDPWNARDLLGARIDHNATFRNTTGLEVAGPGRRDQVSLDHNTSHQDLISLAVQNSTRSQIVANQLAPTATGVGIRVGGGDVGLRIEDNRIEHGSRGIVFTPLGVFIDAFPAPVTGAVVTGNTVTGVTLDAILATPDRLYDSQLVDNTTSDNAEDGIQLRATTADAGNLVQGNTAERNRRYGIYAQGAKGTLFQANTMLANGVLDARDDARDANIWAASQCQTDFPAGTICGLG